jgi:hypothetical protein
MPIRASEVRKAKGRVIKESCIVKNELERSRYYSAVVWRSRVWHHLYSFFLSCNKKVTNKTTTEVGWNDIIGSLQAIGKKRKIASSSAIPSHKIDLISF